MRPMPLLFSLCLLLAAPVAHAAEPADRTEALTVSGKARVGQASPWFGSMLAGGGQHVVNPKLLAEQLTKNGRQAVALLFFATWCKPCEVGLKRLAAEREALAAAGVDLLLVALLEEGEGPDSVAPWLAARGLSDVPLVLDRFSQIARPFGAETVDKGSVKRDLPRTAVLGRDGTIKALFGAEGDDFVARVIAAGVTGNAQR